MTKLYQSGKGYVMTEEVKIMKCCCEDLDFMNVDSNYSGRLNFYNNS